MTHDQRTAEVELGSETLCLDFANTISDDSAHVGDYSELVSWCQNQGALTKRKAARLQDDAHLQPALAERIFRRAIGLRGAIHGVFSTVATGGPPNERNLRTLNREVTEALKHLRIVQTTNNFHWQWDDSKAALEFPLWLVARSVANLLTSQQQSRVQQCGSEDCDWLFLDRSKNRSRRWCDMAECGNREKARRSRMRQRASATET